MGGEKEGIRDCLIAGILLGVRGSVVAGGAEKKITHA